MTDWNAAQKRAAKTARWAVTMTKVRIAQCIVKTKWQLVAFLGPAGGESVGIVDLLAIRKNHSVRKPTDKRGDNFDIVLIQVKGGAARFPSFDEMQRLRGVARRYRAKAVLLGQWKRGRQVQFFRLGRAATETDCRRAWIELDTLADVFH